MNDISAIPKKLWAWPWYPIDPSWPSMAMACSSEENHSFDCFLLSSPQCCLGSMFHLVTRLRLWSCGSGILYMNSFFISKYSAQLRCQQPQPSHELGFFDRSILFYGFEQRFLSWRPSFGRHKLLLVRWKWNSVNHFFAIEIDGAESL